MRFRASGPKKTAVRNIPTVSASNSASPERDLRGMGMDPSVNIKPTVKTQKHLQAKRPFRLFNLGQSPTKTTSKILEAKNVSLAQLSLSGSRKTAVPMIKSYEEMISGIQTHRSVFIPKPCVI